MANKFNMALAGAFSGIGQGLAQIGKEKTYESGVAYDLYIKLLQDPKFKKKKGFEYSNGMTRSQVMQLFEENPEQSNKGFATERIISDAVIDAYKDVIPGLEKYRGGKLTQGDFQFIARRYGFDVRQDIASAQIGIAGSRLEETKLGHKVALLQTYLKMSDADQKRFKSDFKNIFDYMNDPTGTIDIKNIPAGKKSAQLKNKYPGIYNFFRNTPFIGSQIERPGITIGTDTSKGNTIEQEIIENAKNEKGQVSKKMARQYVQQNYPYINFDVFWKQLTGAQTQQTSTPGVAGTSIEGQIGQDLRLGQPTLQKPSSPIGTSIEGQIGQDLTSRQQAEVNSPSTFMPNASPYYRLKTLAYLRNIPRQR